MRNRHGITLVELTMTLSLVGILVTIAAPTLRVDKFRVDGGVLTVGSTMAAQQRNAVMRQHDIVLAFDTTAGTMRVHYDLDNDNAVDAGENVHIVELEEGVVFGRGSTPARPGGGTPSALSMTGTQDGRPALTFARNGSASEASTVYLTSQRALTVGGSSYPDDGRAVEIDRATGRVRCFSHSSGAWRQTC